MTGGAAPEGSAGPVSRLTLERVAHFPPPGSRVAGTFQFTHDGHHLYYLKAEGPEPSLSLVREDVATGAREVVARPPSEGGREAPLSREEILRRERHRLQDKGITQYVLAHEADVVVFTYGRGLWLVRAG